MREFLLYSRTGFTGSRFDSLREGGRLDIVYQCILTSIFKSQAHRKDVVFHAVLNGPPRPPVHVEIRGDGLRDAHIDEESWKAIFKRMLSGKAHHGIAVDKKPLQEVIREKHDAGYSVFLLDKDGEGIEKNDMTGNSLIVVGDHIGFSRADESFIMRYGKKVSIGRQKYLAASCIDIVNYYIDQNE